MNIILGIHLYLTHSNSLKAQHKFFFSFDSHKLNYHPMIISLTSINNLLNHQENKR